MPPKGATVNGPLEVKERNTDRDIDAAAVEFAWRIHQEINDWIGKVDTKAAIILPSSRPWQVLR